MPTRSFIIRAARVALVLAALLPLGACADQRGGIDEADARQMVALLMPQRIEIVEAFTAFASFDDDATPDGIEVLLQAHDAYGDPVKIAGQVCFELCAYRQASGTRQGDRLCDPWFVKLLTEQDQKRYWNTVTGMYEFQLAFPAGSDPRGGGGGGKYVLVATYNTPLDSHLKSECVLTAPGT